MVDPGYVENYLLLPGSLAIDAGRAWFLWNSEIVFELQPEEYVGAAPDLGAYERAAEEPSFQDIAFMPVVFK